MKIAPYVILRFVHFVMDKVEMSRLLPFRFVHVGE